MKTILTTTALSLALLTGAPAMAQDSNSGQASTQQQQQKASYNEADLQKFVEAQSGIKDVRNEYMPKIKNAEKKDKQRELQMSANDEMVSVIKKTGLDIKTYNAIATAYQSNADLREKINGMM
ncbi:hypothetical protein CF392_08540 [Tamilnaduibacter salinus]|uniref:DUF4168 domain-containing protein n=1 Tax=Tamilnaduibacter salinus TaxID=1484056 RepID=A0A2A2I4F6_9GAMM|nr:DUF4168 domain-containing protein [Tamilnaduibacter salinus]PAV25913.1 hypothetical protein CF392_08540 [Tamilnaduibacter salinus]